MIGISPKALTLGAIVSLTASAAVAHGYAPDPSIKGGTLATTSEPVGKMMNDMFAPLAGQFGALAKS